MTTSSESRGQLPVLLEVRLALFVPHFKLMRGDKWKLSQVIGPPSRSKFGLQDGDLICDGVYDVMKHVR